MLSDPQMPTDEYVKKWKSKFNRQEYFHLSICVGNLFLPFLMMLMCVHACPPLHVGVVPFMFIPLFFTLVPELQILSFFGRKHSVQKKSVDFL